MSAQPRPRANGRLATNGQALRRNREDVVRVAGRLFAERGFHGTSMRDLGEALGLLGSSLYAHIGSKNELLVAVIAEGAARFQQLAEEVVAAPVSAREKLARLVAGHVAIVTDDIDAAETLLNEGRHLPAEERRAIVALRDRYQEAFRAVLAEGRAAGEFHHRDDHLTATLALSLLNGVPRWYRPDGGAEPAEIARQVLEFVSGGVGAPALDARGGD